MPVLLASPSQAPLWTLPAFKGARDSGCVCGRLLDSAVMPGQVPKSARLVKGLSLWAAVEVTAQWHCEWCSPKENRQTDTRFVGECFEDESLIFAEALSRARWWLQRSRRASWSLRAGGSQS